MSSIQELPGHGRSDDPAAAFEQIKAAAVEALQGHRGRFQLLLDGGSEGIRIVGSSGGADGIAVRLDSEEELRDAERTVSTLWIRQCVDALTMALEHEETAK